MIRAGLCVGLSALLATSACDKGKAKADTAPASSVPTTAAAASEADNTIPPPGAVAPYVPPSSAPAGFSLTSRFANEASNRPKGVVSVEQVHGAWKAAAAPLKQERQHLASAFHAAYCVGGQLGTDLHTSVCEYASDALAKKGVEVSKQITVPNRKVIRNGQTMLVVRTGDPSNAADVALGAKIIETFKGLKPAPASTPAKK